MLFYKQKKQDPLFETATAFAKETRVLFLDEFQVTDIADAMILRRAFDLFWDSGLILFASSNRQPESLYYNGIQREAFLPFIDDLKKKNTVYRLNSEIDYREAQLLAEFNKKSTDGIIDIFFHPFGQKSQTGFNDLFKRYTDGKTPLPIEITVIPGRVIVLNGVGKIGRFSFKELIESNMGAADFMAICKKFSVIFLEGVPKIDMSNRNVARRFILFVG